MHLYTDITVQNKTTRKVKHSTTLTAPAIE